MKMAFALKRLEKTKRKENRKKSETSSNISAVSRMENANVNFSLENTYLRFIGTKGINVYTQPTGAKFVTFNVIFKKGNSVHA